MPGYDPYAKLDGYKEGMIALSQEGGRFLSYAAGELVSGLPYNPKMDYTVRYWMVFSALNRGDSRTARMYVNDWSQARTRPAAKVHKWNPGRHYHALSERFDTLQEAKDYLSTKGYVFDGFEERRVFPDGD